MVKPMRFLIVEDEWLIADGIEQVLLGAGHVVVGTVATVKQAFEVIGAEALDAVVLDGNLGGQSAEPIADRLAAEKIPFVVVSGNGTMERPGRLGTAPFLKKPFSPHALLKMISFWVLDESQRNMS